MRQFITDTLRSVADDLHDAFPVDGSTKTPHEFVTEQDRATEQHIRRRIKDAYPEHGIIGEELPDRNPDASSQWIIDPIDGTTNYSHNIPFFCAALAYLEDNEVIRSGVTSPLHDTVWYAERGSGAWENGDELTVGAADESPVIGFCHGSTDTSIKWMADHYERLKSELGDARQFGAADLEICLAASGYLDGFLGHHIKPWDFLPGCLIADEAGLTVTGFDGEDWDDPSQDSVIVAPPGFHDDLQRLI
jgi:myo-inositol-1(or 4)-monophosphatase